MARPGTTYTAERSKYTAGHTPFTGSWTSTLSRSGQIHTWRAQTANAMPSRPMWNDRIPVWEQRIPEFQAALSTQQRSPNRRARTPFSQGLATTSNSTVTRDWSLLLSPGSGTTIRRPWPEYEPESSAAVGRRWNGTNLGRLYEHVQPSGLSMSQSVASMPLTPLRSPDAGF